ERGHAIDRDVALQPVPARGQVHRGDLEGHERVLGRRDLEDHRLHPDLARTFRRASGRPGRIDPNLVRQAIGPAQEERPLDGDGEPLVRGPDRDGLVHALPQVPCCQEWRYSSCSAVSSSISTFIARSLSLATSWSISGGTGYTRRSRVAW